ncbi:MAG TPA: hypothetical protein VN174_00215 [Candidatus Methanoperedens sp.]|nr:hypothetical protein [Candidatus Methanoperedens sp.]
MSLNLEITKLYSRVSPLFTYLEKKKEDQKLVRTVEIGGTFFLISFFILFAIKPTFLTISALVGDIKAKEEMTKQLKVKINDIIQAQDLFSLAQERYALVEASLPTTPRFFQSNLQVLGATTKYQVNLDKIDYFMKKEQDNYTVNLSTSTSFSSAISVVSDLLKNRRLIDLDGLTLSVNEDFPGQINVILPLKVYYWRDNAKK